MYLSQLTLKDREWLQELIKLGYNLEHIAKKMDRSHSCIKAEVRKNGGRSFYNAQEAEKTSKLRKSRSRNGVSEEEISQLENEMLECIEETEKKLRPEAEMYEGCKSIAKLIHLHFSYIKAIRRYDPNNSNS